ncbi:uncharacterized protein TNCV_4573101 [Trichonephila clavipes]|nr:uncharacterized protein TNCV_4573101 [Trichonephila clavipes]
MCRPFGTVVCDADCCAVNPGFESRRRNECLKDNLKAFLNHTKSYIDKNSEKPSALTQPKLSLPNPSALGSLPEYIDLLRFWKKLGGVTENIRTSCTVRFFASNQILQRRQSEFVAPRVLPPAMRGWGTKTWVICKRPSFRITRVDEMITRVVNNVDSTMLSGVWQELDNRIGLTNVSLMEQPPIRSCVFLRHRGTLYSRRAACSLVRLVEGEEKWEALPQGVFLQNVGVGKTSQIVLSPAWGSKLQLRTGVQLCHDIFHGPRSGCCRSDDISNNNTHRKPVKFVDNRQWGLAMSERSRLPDSLRWRAVGWMEMELSQADAARRLNVSCSVVHRLWNQYQTEASVSRRHVIGRPRAETGRRPFYLFLSEGVGGFLCRNLLQTTL